MGSLSDALSAINSYTSETPTARLDEQQKTAILQTVDGFKDKIPTLSSHDVTQLKKALSQLSQRAELRDGLNVIDQKISEVLHFIENKVDLLIQQKSVRVFEHAANQAEAFRARRAIKSEISENKKLVALPADSKNIVFLQKAAQAVFKSQTVTGMGSEISKFEKRANDIAALVGAPRTLNPSIRGDFANADFAEETSLSAEVVSGNIQPLIMDCVQCDVIAKDKPLFNAIAERLVLGDSQQKTLVQGLIGNRDLHMSNGMMQPLMNEDYSHMRGMIGWEYQDKKGDWQPVSSFLELTKLYIRGDIDDATKVKSAKIEEIEIGKYQNSDEDERNGLKNALNTDWQFVFFDNEETCPYYNDFRTTREGVVLPVQVFMTGMQFSNKPLEPDVKDWIKAMPAKREALERYSTQGNPNVMKRLSPDAKESLALAFKDPRLEKLMHEQFTNTRALVDALPNQTKSLILSDLNMEWEDKNGYREKCDRFLQLLDVISREGGERIAGKMEDITLSCSNLMNFVQYPATASQEPEQLIYSDFSDLTNELQNMLDTVVEDMKDEGVDTKQLEAAIKEIIQLSTEGEEDSLIDAYKDSGLKDFREKALGFIGANIFPAMPPLAAESLLARETNLVNYLNGAEERIEVLQQARQTAEGASLERQHEVLDQVENLLRDAFLPQNALREALQKKEEIIASGLTKESVEDWLNKAEELLQPTTKSAFYSMYPTLLFYHGIWEETGKKIRSNDPESDYGQMSDHDIELESGTSVGHPDETCDQILQKALAAKVFTGEDDPRFVDAVEELNEVTGQSRFIEG